MLHREFEFFRDKVSKEDDFIFVKDRGKELSPDYSQGAEKQIEFYMWTLLDSIKLYLSVTLMCVYGNCCLYRVNVSFYWLTKVIGGVSYY